MCKSDRGFLTVSTASVVGMQVKRETISNDTIVLSGSSESSCALSVESPPTSNNGATFDSNKQASKACGRSIHSHCSPSPLLSAPHVDHILLGDGISFFNQHLSQVSESVQEHTEVPQVLDGVEVKTTSRLIIPCFTPKF